ncbi:MAG: toll/interleukin-1 receptor domain-containing protein, partial [Lewinellaceae bacterium]|nr:toll/interleukin-1 receptor domain-containing protein [Lewinellaceae bacterium]
MPKKPSIFINYRRERTRDKAIILRIILEAHFGEGSVFLDKESITVGRKWREELQNGLNEAEVLLCLIHHKWHAETDEKGDNRLKLDPDDWVRQEIAGAMGRIPIIPIRIDGAEMPKEAYLPEPLKGFCDNQGIELDFKNLSDEAMQKLLKSLRKHISRWQDGNQTPTLPEYGNSYYSKAISQIFPLPPAKSKGKGSPNACPYIGLKPFSREDAHLFFGRSREIYNTCYKIIHQDTPRLLLLDGYSGTGKSSLLQAGIIPRIEKQGLAVAYGRREQDKYHGLSGVLQMLEAELSGKPEEKGLLILDQVEEAITSPIDIRPRELQELAENLAVLLQSRPS